MRIPAILALTAALLPAGYTLARQDSPPGPKTAPLVLSDSERSWVQRHRTIRVSTSERRSADDNLAGALYRGIAGDYLKLACARLGITPLLMPGLTWQESWNRLREKRGVDLMLSPASARERGEFQINTDSFFSSPQVLFTRKDGHFISGVKDLSGKVLAVSGGPQLEGELRRDVPGVVLLEVPSSAQGLQAVCAGKADAFLQSLALGSYAMEKSGLGNLKVAAPAPYGDEELALAVRKDWPELAVLLNRALASLSAGEREAIRQRWLSQENGHDIRATEVVTWVALVTGGSLCLILLLGRTIRVRTTALLDEVTLRARAMAELEGKKRFLDHVIECLPILFYVHDGRRFLRWNSAFEKVMGLTAQELAGMTPLAIIHGDDRALALQKRSEAFQSGESELECRLLTKEGTRHYSISGRRMQWKGNLCVVGTATDLTEQKLAASAVRESERHFREMLENLRLIAITFDTEDRLTFCNDFLLELTGWQRHETLGKNWFEMFYPDAAEARSTFHEAFGRGATSLHREKTILTHNGTRRVISWNSTLLRNPLGEEIGMACIGEDVTDRKHYENALQNISAGVSAATGAAFLKSLVSHLAQALDVDYAMIGELPEGADRVTTVAVASNRQSAEDFGYGLQGTPFESIFGKELGRHQDGLCQLIPEKGLLGDLGVEGFAAAPLCNGSGELLGVLAVLSGRPFANAELVEAMLGIFAVRAAAEMERTKSEQAQRMSEEKYRLLFDRMLNGYAVHEVICDDSGRPVDYRFLEVNAAFEKLTGLRREELIGRRVRELMPHTEEIWIEKFGAVALSEQPDDFEGFCQPLSKWLKVAAYSPKPGQFAVTFSDITKRKLAEQALRESEERAHQIFNQNDDGVILFKMDTFEIIDANPAALELYGISREDFKGLKPWAFINPSDFRKLIKAIPRDNHLVGFHLDKAVNYTKDGNRFMASIRCKILILSNEYVILCSVRDITEKARLEEEMKETQAKLIQTNKMTSLGMLVSGMAHEINNPNNFISVNALLLSDAWQDATPILREHAAARGDFTLGGLPFSEMQSVVPRLFTGISEGASRISSIVNNMRNFVRKEETGEYAAIDVNRSIESAASLLWHHIHRFTDSFGMDLQAGLPPANGNAQQVEQVIINLIMNALQALPGKECGVQVTSSLSSDSGSIVIAVIDEGHGMKAKVRKHLTEPFFSTRIGQGGTGLGLYISSSIIKEHQGSLCFESAPGKGTTATIRLPRGDSAPGTRGSTAVAT